MTEVSGTEASQKGQHRRATALLAEGEGDR